ncbi:MAG: acyl-CoA dehydrogenase [Proteobacteria bacterium]|nr:acyl-CoA dehydrogenase [Pseudomonadota bacterium]MBU1387175.1 acyl-CoA dehydrogenase [Pseudomonadota bacterium]MBU1541507.1 acyl-CoA dehydrogenase [Pseudomonadota bacterium]MBU2430250.1 acyl-CoA dehydrogenase [Pseudomonadota bacterium]MBU2482138.1 acyl-CoA dehydrogenase [Pseudomonadota bacterium]
MAQQLVDLRDVEFVIWEQLETEEMLKHEKYEEFNKKTCDLIMKEARNLAIKEILPTMSIGDEKGVVLKDGVVTTPEEFKRPFELLKEGEWPGLRVPPEMGGQGAPQVVGVCANEYFMAGNWPINCYTHMGNGAAWMIQEFGTKEQKEMYVKRITSAEWGGTMLLTEPDAGSDVGALTTTAVKNADGTYSITGNKIFITNGEHDLCSNIIHPVLARIEGDEPGTKGISIFLVPKILVNADGTLGERNDIWCTGVEHKHGIKGSATCSMTMGAKGKCIGTLLGKEKEGMKIMFMMMNEARLGTGLQGLAYASGAYLLALNYAKERIQGRDLKDFAKRDAPGVAIINHPDVRRNLLKMKAYVCGMRSFFYWSTQIGEKNEYLSDKRDPLQSAYFDLMTPIIKEYLSKVGHDVCVEGMQVLGGAGYTKDYLAEQYTRDCKICSIYEGTSGIQAQDLVGRKLGAMKGQAFMKFIGDIMATTAKAKKMKGLEDIAAQVEALAAELGKAAGALGKKLGAGELKAAFAHSLPFLHAMGDTLVAWMLLWRAVTATEKMTDKVKKKDEVFYDGQIKTAQFFIQTEVPVTMGKIAAVIAGSTAAIDIDDAGFGGL